MEFEELRAAAAATGEVEKLPKALPIERITEMHKAFQPRRINEAHVDLLRRVIRDTGEALEPLLVWQAGGKVFLLDGHHRAAAYRAEGFTEAVPVREFRGTLAGAQVEAGKANSQARLPMTPTERLDWAWRLVRLGGTSKHQTATAASVSERTVANMRNVLKQLGDDVPTSWWAAQRKAKGELEEWTEDREAVEVEEWTRRLQKEFGNKLTDNPQRFAEVVMRTMGGRLTEFLSVIRTELGSDAWEEVSEDIDHDEF